MGNYRLLEKTIFERSRPGRMGVDFGKDPFPAVNPEALLGADLVRQGIEGFPELAEVDVVRHFTRLSLLNYCIDHGLFPLGSCTMKYNPRLNERIAAMPSFGQAHPMAPAAFVQGCLKVMKELEEVLEAVTGMDAFTLQPAAGAHGELTGMLIIRAHHEAKGDARKVVLIPDSAHGTNPCSAVLAGYSVREVKSGPDGRIDLSALQEALSEDVAAMMVTNPNTLGVFETRIDEVAKLLHGKGALLYMDGANLNALMGVVRPRDTGVDVMHLNLHKTFSTPHGGGGPGAGPVGVTSDLAGFLPVPRIVVNDGVYSLEEEAKESIGRVHGFFGNFGVVLRALAYCYTLGGEGLAKVSRHAVLNANYVRSRLAGAYHLPYATDSLHEVVLNDKVQEEKGVTTLQISKRLMDKGLHPPTIYFPLIVHGALMIEPTETEGKEELDRFIQAMLEIARESAEQPETLAEAPKEAPISKLDEVRAARRPVLRYRRDS